MQPNDLIISLESWPVFQGIIATIFDHHEKPPIFMLSCGHDFCYDCLLGAFSNNNSCPECRAVQSVEHIDQLNRNRRLEKAVLSLKTTKTEERRADEEDYSALITRIGCLHY